MSCDKKLNPPVGIMADFVCIISGRYSPLQLKLQSEIEATAILSNTSKLEVCLVIYLWNSI